MADLKSLGRAIGQPNAPDISGAAQAAGALGKVAEGVSNFGANIVEESAKLDASFVNAEFSQALNTAFIDASTPANISNVEGGTAIDRYHDFSSALIDDALETVPKNLRSELKLSLQNTANANLLKLRSSVQNDVIKKQTAAIEQGITAEVQNIYNYVAEGNTFNAVQSEKNAYDFIRQARISGYLDDKSEAKLMELVKQTKLEAKYTKMGEDAVHARPGTASKIAEHLALTRDGMSQSEYEEAVQAFGQGVKRAEALVGGEKQKQVNAQKALIMQALIDLEEKKKFGTIQEQDEARDKYFKLVEGAKNEEYITPQEALSVEHEAQEGLIQLRTKKEVERLQAEVLKKEEALKQFTIGGHQQKAKEIQEEIKTLMGRMKNLNAITESDVFKENLKIRDIDFSSRYLQRGINDALAAPGTPEQQLVDFARSGLIEPEATETDKITAINAYMTGVNFSNQMLQQQRAINAAEVGNRISDGSITNVGQLAPYDLTLLQQKQAESQMIKQTTKRNAQEVELTNDLRMVQAGGGAQNRIPTAKRKEAVFASMANQLTDIRKEQTGDPDYQLNRSDVMQIYKEMNTPVPHLTSRLNYALLQADPEKEQALIEDSLAMVRELSDNPNVLSDIDAKARSAAIKINSAALHGQNLDMRNLVEKARDTVNPKDPEKEERAKRYNALPKKDLDKLYKSVLPGDPGKSVDARGQFSNLVSLYNMTSDSLEDAALAAGQAMQPLYGEDKFFEPDTAGYLPSKAAVPYSEVGHWYTNQIYLSLYGLTERQKNDPSVAATDKVSWIYPDLPESLSEETLFKDNLLALGDATRPEVGVRSAGKIPLQARWRGKNVDVYYFADGMSRINDNEKPKYVFYIKQEDGQKYYITDPKSKDGSGFFVEYPQNLGEFLPNYFNEQDTQDFENKKLKVYQAERATRSGTRKGTIKELNEAKKQELEQIEKGISSHKTQPTAKNKKPSKENIVNRLLEGD